MNQNLANVKEAGDKRPCGLSFFKKLKAKAISEGRMVEDICTEEAVETAEAFA